MDKIKVVFGYRRNTMRFLRVLLQNEYCFHAFPPGLKSYDDLTRNLAKSCAVKRKWDIVFGSYDE